MNSKEKSSNRKVWLKEKTEKVLTQLISDLAVVQPENIMQFIYEWALRHLKALQPKQPKIEVKDKSKTLTIIEGCLSSKERDVPEYIQLDDKNKTAKLIRVPKFAEVPFPVIMEPSLVIEYYSR